MDFDHAADAPPPRRWLGFLAELFGDDTEAINLLGEWFGYCLTGNTSLQKMLLIVGPKRSGKGTIGRVLRRLVGVGNVANPTTTSLAGTFGLQPLIGKSHCPQRESRPSRCPSVSPARLTIAAVPDEHSSGTVPPEIDAAQAPAGRTVDVPSCALPGWPRLMPVEMACQYVGLGRDTLLGYVHDGSLRVTRPLRPNTARAHGYRGGKSRRTLAHVETLRRLLFDRVDLDALVDRWKREGAA